MSKRVRVASVTCPLTGSSRRSWLLVLAPLLGLALLFGVWSALPPPTVIGTAAQAAQAQKARSQGGQVATGRALVKQSKEQIRELHAQQQQAAGVGGTGKSSIRGSGSGGGSGGSDSTAMSAQAGAPPASARVVVVGGGLAGLTAALTAAEQLAAAGGAAGAAGAGAGSSAVYEVDVLVVEKMPRLGGNSAKASSGMNALNPQGGDSEPLFSSDTLSSGGGASVPELVQRLVHDSPAALSFLESHGVALAGVTQLGGHSVPRTRTVTAGANVGWAIMSALSAAVKAHPRIRVLEGYSIKRIVNGTQSGAESRSGAESAGGGAQQQQQQQRPQLEVTSVVLAESGGGAAGGTTTSSSDAPATSSVRCGALVLATGGYAANRDLLKRYAPEAADLATTNGPWAAGDALQLAEEAGAALVGLQDVQVHPTGFVDPADPNSQTKFLAPEKLRGVGGLLLAPGTAARFANELGRRDDVAGALARLPGRTAWLLLGAAAAAEYGSGALGFYCSKGLMTKAETLAEAAAAMDVTEAALRGTLADYLRVAEQAQKQQQGGAGARAGAGLEATAGGAAAGAGRVGTGAADEFGKRVFRNAPHPDTDLPIYVARVTPVVHYTMGGVAINQQAQVLRAPGPGQQPAGVIGGLYAAGEVSGGVHGHNRLGGNSLLECVVYGRVAGLAAATAATATAATATTATAASSTSRI